MPHMRRYKTSVLAVSFDGPSNVVAFCVKSRGLLRIHSNKGPHVKYYGINGGLLFYYNYSAFMGFNHPQSSNFDRFSKSLAVACTCTTKSTFRN